MKSFNSVFAVQVLRILVKHKNHRTMLNLSGLLKCLKKKRKHDAFSMHT